MNKMTSWHVGVAAEAFAAAQNGDTILLLASQLLQKCI